MADAEVKPRSLLPKEHGAYAEAGFPIATGLVMSRGEPAAILFSVATATAFLIHEPVLVLLGHRGERAQRDHGERAKRRAVVLGIVAAITGLVAVAIAPQEASMWLFLPILLAVMMVPRILGGTMKTLIGELLAGLALTTMVLPIALSGGVVPLTVAGSGAVVWAVTFVISTLAVRAIVQSQKLRKQGADAPASTGPGSLRGRLNRNTERTVVLLVSAWTIIGMVLTIVFTRLSPWAVLAAAPGAIAGLTLGILKISARSLKKVGWTLVAVYFSTLGLLIVASL